ncbi:MAG: PRC-barrel domain-containing protein [Roseiflexaceae bacterium]
MDLPINATIACTNGPGGHSTAIILNPVSDQVTHLVVREPGLLGIERMTPVEFVTESTPELIRLRCTTAELAHMPPFVTTNYLPASPGSLAGYSPGMMLWPYISMPSGVSVNHENIALDALAIHRGAQVHATDGYIGEVEEFVLNPANDGITHVILREGHFWNHQDITIPITQIDQIDNDVVYLTLTKHQIAALPALAVQRRSR